VRASLVLVLVAGLWAGTAIAKVPVVPPGQLLVSDRDGRLLVVDGAGRVQRRLTYIRTGCCPGQVELSADRRHAFVSVSRNERFSLLEVDLVTGKAIRIAAGGSAALSPDGRRLAYYAISTDNGIPFRTAVVVRDLASGRSHAIRFAEPAVWGNPPDVLINWSPDGRKLAVVGLSRRHGGQLHIVDVDHAHTIESQPNLGHLLAPVFLDPRTIVALANCCRGTHQEMVAVSLGSGAHQPFATLPEPPESLRRVGSGTFVATTPDGFLLRFSQGHVRRLGRGTYFSVSG